MSERIIVHEYKGWKLNLSTDGAWFLHHGCFTVPEDYNMAQRHKLSHTFNKDTDITCTTGMKCIKCKEALTPVVREYFLSVRLTWDLIRTEQL